MSTIAALLVVALATLADAAPTTFQVQVLDTVVSGDDGTVHNCVSGTACYSQIKFADTFRFMATAPTGYQARVVITSQTVGVCYTGIDVYTAQYALVNNSAAGFQASASRVTTDVNPSNWTLNFLPCTQSSTYYFGVAQHSHGFLGACPHGFVSIEVIDQSVVCGYSRADDTCYQGDECSNAATNVVATPSSTVCCPPGNINNAGTSTACTCDSAATRPGSSSTPPAPPFSYTQQPATATPSGDLTSKCVQQCGQDCNCFSGCCVCQPGQSQQSICGSVINGVPLTKCQCSGAALTPSAVTVPPPPPPTPQLTGFAFCVQQQRCTGCACANACCDSNCGTSHVTTNCVVNNTVLTVHALSASVVAFRVLRANYAAVRISLARATKQSVATRRRCCF
jgi:hypothetical protein